MESLARLRLISQTGSAAHVTELLGIEPSVAYEVGDRIRKTGRIYDSSVWYLDSGSGIEEGVELADSLRKLLDKVEAADAMLLWQLDGEGYFVNWPCIVGSQALNMRSSWTVTPSSDY